MTLPSRPVVGMLHPGAMGAALGAALKPVAGEVVWADAGRSHATAKRAELADLVAVPDVPRLVSAPDRAERGIVSAALLLSVKVLGRSPILGGGAP